jgi:hypothetical protein
LHPKLLEIVEKSYERINEKSHPACSFDRLSDPVSNETGVRKDGVQIAAAGIHLEYK